MPKRPLSTTLGTDEPFEPWVLLNCPSPPSPSDWSLPNPAPAVCAISRSQLPPFRNRSSCKWTCNLLPPSAIPGNNSQERTSQIWALRSLQQAEELPCVTLHSCVEGLTAARATRYTWLILGAREENGVQAESGRQSEARFDGRNSWKSM